MWVHVSQPVTFQNCPLQIRTAFRSKKASQHSLADKLRQQRAYRNPAFMANMASKLKLQQYGVSTPVDVKAIQAMPTIG